MVKYGHLGTYSILLPSSRSLLAGEQSDTLCLLQHNDRKSRHRPKYQDPQAISYLLPFLPQWFTRILALGLALATADTLILGGSRLYLKHSVRSTHTFAVVETVRQLLRLTGLRITSLIRIITIGYGY